MTQWHDGDVRLLDVAQLGDRYRRYRFTDPDAETVMAGSLRRYGQLSPLVVCLRAETHELLDGFKRLAAARTLGINTLNARLLEVDERAVTATSVVAILSRPSASDPSSALGFRDIHEQRQFVRVGADPARAAVRLHGARRLRGSPGTASYRLTRVLAAGARPEPPRSTANLPGRLFRRLMATNGTSENVGKLIEIKGVVVDAVFPNKLPEIYSALRITRPDGGEPDRGGAAAPRRRPRARGRDGHDRRARARHRRGRHGRADLGARRRRDARPASGTSSATRSTARAPAGGHRALADPPRPAGLQRTSRRRSRSSRRGSRSST